MSRRHHGGRSHRSHSPGRRPTTPLVPPADASRQRIEPPAGPPAQPPAVEPAAESAPATRAEQPPDPPVQATASASEPTVAPAGPRAAAEAVPEGRHEAPSGNGHAAPAGCTAPQLRRFIKSRPYVPMHELRRRFGINGAEDDVTAVDLADGRVYVGLPAREGGLLGELLRGGEIGYELSLDPRSPVVVGLYPMRPVPRP